MGEMIIREFQPGDEAAFRALNEAWIRRHFAMEPKDEAGFADPWRTVIEPGGRIFIAVMGEMPAGCCALLAVRPGEFEVAKMTVTERLRGAGVGRRLLEHAILAAREAGARRLFLETNHVLTNAIRLYESVGFRHIPSEEAPPSPYARSDVAMEMFLDAV